MWHALNVILFWNHLSDAHFYCIYWLFLFRLAVDCTLAINILQKMDKTATVGMFSVHSIHNAVDGSVPSNIFISERNIESTNVEMEMVLCVVCIVYLADAMVDYVSYIIYEYFSPMPHHRSILRCCIHRDSIWPNIIHISLLHLIFLYACYWLFSCINWYNMCAFITIRNWKTVVTCHGVHDDADDWYGAEYWICNK